MSIREFAKFYEVAKDRELREMNYLAWCVQLPMMDSKSFISFEDYHRKMTGADVDMRPAEDIINEVEQIRREIYGNITV